jgi:hypothetical protein
MEQYLIDFMGHQLYRIPDHKKICPLASLAIVGIGRFFGRFGGVDSWPSFPPVQFTTTTTPTPTTTTTAWSNGNSVGWKAGSHPHAPGPVVSTRMVIGQANAQIGTSWKEGSIHLSNDMTGTRTLLAGNFVADRRIRDFGMHKDRAVQ